VALIGRIYYNITNILLRDINVAVPRIEIIPKYGLLFDINRITGIVEFDFSYTNRGIISGSGKGRVTLKRMEFQTKLGVSIRNGFPELSLRDLIFKIHDWDINLQGNSHY
jgi:hypothetical protein